MLTRRLFCGCLPVLASGFAATGAGAQTAECAVFTPERQKAVLPSEALARLQQGNQRFVSGKTINCDLIAQVKATSHDQAPFAAVLGCIDSRVPPELVFDQRIGDMFVARVAGNFANTDIIGSLEYATKVAGAKVICVLGHSGCGAIKSAVDNVKLGNITALLANFDKAVEAGRSVGGENSSKNHERVQAVADANVQLTTRIILERSPIIKELVDSKNLLIVGAMHDLSTGKVSFF
jgi:carbonic anhydrase